MSLRLLCICAHPDDECFAFGGALALAANRGIETSVLCLTDGQAATNRGTSTSNKNLGDMRRAEFEASCKVLGVKNHELWDYQDAKLEFENFSVLTERLTAYIRKLRPHIVLTFGLEGGLNSHPDHTTVALATTAAFHWAGNPKRYLDSGPVYQPQRLFYVTSSFVLPERHIPLLAPYSIKLDITSVSTARRKSSASTPRRPHSWSPPGPSSKSTATPSTTPWPPPRFPNPPAKPPTSSLVSRTSSPLFIFR